MLPLITAIAMSTITFSGLLPEGTDAVCLGMSRDGLAVYGAATVPSPYGGYWQRGFSWVNGALTDVGTEQGGVMTSTANGGSAGTIVGTVSDMSACRFCPDGIHRITASYGSQTYDAFDLSADGQTVVGWEGRNRQVSRAYVWTPDGTRTLDTLTAGSWPFDMALACSADGTLAVGEAVTWVNGDPVPTAVKWDTGSLAVSELPCPFDPCGGSYAVDCSADGSSVLCFGFTYNGAFPYMVYVAGNVAVPLPALSDTCEASSISQDGTVFCGSYWNGSSWAPYVAATIGRNVPLSYIVNPAGWTLEDAVSVERNGTNVVVAGTALADDGHREAYRLTLSYGQLILSPGP